VPPQTRLFHAPRGSNPEVPRRAPFGLNVERRLRSGFSSAPNIMNRGSGDRCEIEFRASLRDAKGFLGAFRGLEARGLTSEHHSVVRAVVFCVSKSESAVVNWAL